MAKTAMTDGYRALKFHGTGLLETDFEAIERCRSVLGERVALMWDGSSAYHSYDAGIIARALEASSFLFFEAPFSDADTSARRRLARASSVPLVPDGMDVRFSDDWVRDVLDGVWAAVRFDVTRTRSVHNASGLLRLAEVVGLPCEVQSFGHGLSQLANLHVMLTSAACRFFESPYPTHSVVDDLATAPEIVDGVVRLPTASGLGHGLVPGDLDSLPRLCHVS